MNLESFLSTVTHRSETIIQWAFLAIVLLIGTLVARMLFGKGESAAPAPAGPSPDLQAVLDKITEQTAKLEGVALKEMSPAGVAEVEAQVQALKKDLASRDEEISKLKAAGPSKAADDAGELSARIKELETKLAEYEILEDDIADLSLYKEENSRLRAELEKVKGGGTMPAATPAPPAPAAEQIVEEFAQAVNAPPVGEAGGAPAAAEMNIPDTGNPMADFESTVELERKLAGAVTEAAAAPPAEPAPAPAPAPVAEAPAPAEPAPAPAAAAAAPAGPPAEADDLFAEFSTSTPDPLEGTTLDTDKMMEEMAALVSVEPTGGNALEESIDIEKMAMEAKKS